MLERARVPRLTEAEQMQLHRRVAERVSLDTHALGVASIYRRLLQREPETALG